MLVDRKCLQIIFSTVIVGDHKILIRHNKLLIVGQLLIFILSSSEIMYSLSGLAKWQTWRVFVSSAVLKVCYQTYDNALLFQYNPNYTSAIQTLKSQFRSAE